MESGHQSQRRKEASRLLSEIAKKTGNPRLSALALSVKLDAFKRVIKAIDDMIAELMEEKKAEIKHRDYCIKELNNNERDTERKDREKKDLLALIDDLTMTIDTLTKEIDTLKSEVAEMQHQLKIAGEDRELENKDFQQVVADQRATQQLLENALNVLKGFYDKALVQTSVSAGQPAGPPPPPGFKKYEKSSGAGGVMGMLEQIVPETKTMEADAIKAETD